jgi:hypothetical protein
VLVKKHDHVREFFESRSRAEDDAASPRTPRNRLHVSSLVALLEENRDTTVFGRARGDGDGYGAGAGGGAVEVRGRRRLAEKYGMDVERFERLVRSVNVPSVREGGGSGDAGSVRYVRDAESGEDVPVREVSPFFLSRRPFFFLICFCTGRVEGAKTLLG